MLAPCPIPGLFITGTDTSVGKTVIAAAIASHLKSLGRKIAVCKPIATGIESSEHLIIESLNTASSMIQCSDDSMIQFSDAAFLAHHAGTDFPLDLINPVRYRDPLAPAVAAGRENRPVDWQKINDAIAAMSRTSDAIIVEGIGGILVPLDAQYTLLDMIKWLQLPAVIVARASLGTINHTLLTLQTLRTANIPVAGVIINRFPACPDLAEQTNPAAIAQFGRTRILAVVPDTASPMLSNFPREILSPISQIDWLSLMRSR